MAIVNHFYHGLIKKYISLFGISFNKLTIERSDNTGIVQEMIVPISYGPYQKFLARLNQDPTLDKKSAITLPRMAFEITSIDFDSDRKISRLQKIKSNEPSTENGLDYTYAPIPFNFEFSLYIMTKNAEDGAQLVEQILPIMTPEWTYTVKLLENIDAIDIPIIYRGISIEDLYDGSFEQRRSMVWTINFTMKGYLFGPIKKKKLIKFIDARLSSNLESNAEMEEQIQIYPGLTLTGEPTSDPTLTVNYTDIYEDENWGLITVIQDEIEE